MVINPVPMAAPFVASLVDIFNTKSEYVLGIELNVTLAALPESVLLERSLYVFAIMPP